MAQFQLPAIIQTRSVISQGITIYYPSVQQLPNLNIQERINQTIYNSVQGMIQEQQKYQTGTNPEVVGHYEIKTNERGILSLTLSNYTYTYPMAHGYTILKSLTFELNSGKEYTLQDLFKPGSDFIPVLSALVKEQIKQRDIPLIRDFHSIRLNQDYYLADKSLIIYFQLYEITPYYYGFPMFPISVYDVQNISTDTGLLATLSADIA